jgi:hypothetical protein
LAALPLASCATPPPPPVLTQRNATAAETDFLCSVLPRYLDQLGNSVAGADHARLDRLRPRLDRIELLPARLPDCPSGTVPIWGARYFDGFGLDATGELGVISGGWQAAPLAGASGVCYFERGPQGWTLLACLMTSVS